MEQLNFTQAPYHFLSQAERNQLQAAADITFYRAEENIITIDDEVAQLYIVMKGVVSEQNADGEVQTLYHAGDTFDARALMQGHSHHHFIAAEETLVHTLPKAVISQLMEHNPRFGAYFYANVAEKLASLSSHSDNEFETLFTAKVRDAYRNSTVWLDGEASILEAAQAMKIHKTKSLLVRHQNQVGLFTESAFRDILIAAAPASTPLHQWSTFNLISVDIDDFVFNALLRMTQHQIQRVIVLENNQPIGALEQIDILAYFSNHSHLVAQRLERAQNLDELTDIATQMTQSIQILHNNGVRAPQLAQLMQVLNTALFEKAWRIIAPPELFEHSCLIVMGSEGRGEQVLKTDQDNALIFREHISPETARAAAETFSHTLEKLGYPPCPGKIMVNNPAWRLPLSEFKQTIKQWCLHPSPNAMMNLAIFIDAKAAAGDASLLDEVKQHLRQTISNDAGMLMSFARAVELFDSHNQGFFSQLLRRGQHERMDIKKMGTFPIVHGIRALSLEAKLEETNTFERIRRLVQLHILDEQLGRDTSEALAYLMDVRLKSGLAFIKSGEQVQPNQVDMHQLSTLERDLLKEALQVVKRFKAMIHHHFHLGVR